VGSPGGPAAAAPAWRIVDYKTGAPVPASRLRRPAGSGRVQRFVIELDNVKRTASNSIDPACPVFP